MNKKLLALVSEWWVYKSLYEYSITNEDVIPVVVVSEYTQTVTDELQSFWLLSWIVLTENDIHRGHDVYSIILYHIQCRSICMSEDDILKTIKIDSTSMRHNLEWHIRHVLIDLREALIQWETMGEMFPWVSIQLDRIWFSCLCLLTWMVNYDSSVAEIIEMIKEKWGIDHWELYRTLHHGAWTVDLYQTHELLLELVEYIDTFNKKTTTK